MIHRNGVTLIGCLLLYIAVAAQHYPFVQYTPKDGLVNSRVRKLFQDSRGRMYFMTYGGLSRYDGARFINYTVQNGLATDMVNDMIELGDDSLLIVTNTNQLNVLVHGQMKKFGQPDKNQTIVNQVLKSNDGHIYAAADQGLFILNGLQFEPFLEENNNPYLGTLVEWGDFLICGTNDLRGYKGIYIYDKKQRQLTDERADLLVSGLAKDRSNHIWAAFGEGIRMLDTIPLQQGKIKFDVPAHSFEQLSGVGGGSFSFGAHDVWLMKSRNEIIKAGDDGSMITIKFPDQEGQAGHNTVFIDLENIAWICTEANGVFKFANTDLHTESLGREKNSPVVIKSALYVHDTTWYLLNDKLLARKTRHEYHEFKAVVPEGFLFIGQYEGVIKGSDGKNMYSARIPHVDQSIVFSRDLTLPDTSSLEAKALLDPNGNIVTYSRTHLYVVKQNRIIYQLPLQPDDFIEGIQTDSSSKLWVLTRYSGIMIFSVHPETPENYLQPALSISTDIKNISPRSMLLDKNNIIWIGTRYTGLLQYWFNGYGLEKLRQFQTTDGLTDNFVTSLARDSSGNIIAGTQTGLDRLIVSAHGIFRIENITRSNNIFGLMKMIWVNRLNETYTLTNTGSLLVLSPFQNSDKNFQPQLFIEEIRINNKAAPSVTASMRLPFRSQDLVFDLAAPTFKDEKQVLYSYRLAGNANGSWSEPTANATINLLNLAPGDYELEVRAFFRSTAYSPKELSYHFTITPPWWQTWWARLLMWVLIAAILVLIVTFYYRRKLEIQKAKLEKQQAVEKERMRIASDMHDDLGAGLSTIKFLSEKLGQTTTNEKERSDANRIAANSNELVQKMNEIIWAMNEKNDTLEDLLFYTRSYSMEYCEENGLECNTDLPGNIHRIFVSGEIRRNVFLTVKECLHNIVKHAHATKVNIDFEAGKVLSVIISDNGTGLTITSDDEREGNGLRNMQRRIESVNGTFRIANDNGVVVSIVVPLEE